MRAVMTLLVAAILSVGPAWAQETISVAAAPPVVVKTVPQSGDTKVDPGLQQLQVTFSKAMQEGCSWSQISDETMPQVTGKPHYLADGRTCVLPVKLQPGKTYVIWLNSEKFKNFRDADGRPAFPYLLIFETRASRTPSRRR